MPIWPKNIEKKGNIKCKMSNAKCKSVGLETTFTFVIAHFTFDILYRLLIDPV
jgi:hypothetical protein